MNLKPQLFTGDASQAEARVYASLPRAGLPTDARLAGELIGPHCRYSQTLPARIPFIDRGPGESLLAEAIVPDPCFWTPELPFIYSARLRIDGQPATQQTSETTVFEHRPFGIRRLGVQGTSVYLDAKRFVLRGVHRDTAEIADLKTARDAATALFVDSPSEQFLREASDEGVLLVVDCTAHRLDLQAELVRLSGWPAVVVVVLDANAAAGKELRLAARGTLLAQRYPTDSSAPAQPWAHIAWCEIDESSRQSSPPRDLPTIIYRPHTEHTTIEEGRRHCDRLQSDLAPLNDFAGYFT